jgi:multidrug efflux system membrane fusion protein
MSNHTKKHRSAQSESKHGSGSSLARSSFTALFILVLIAAWMASGEIVIGGSDTDKVPPIAVQNSDSQKAGPQNADSPQAAKKKLFTVRARLFTSRPRNEVLHIRARSEADIRVEVRAETSGRVETINGVKGRLIKQGSVLCKLDEGARRASLLQAQAQVIQTQSDYIAAAKLAKRGFSAKLNVNVKRAAYDGAMAAVKKARIDLDNTSIKAPFTGIIERRPVKVGDFLSIGTPCADLVKLHPLLIVGDVSERIVNKLSVGQNGRAELVTGETVPGKIRFISPSAKVTTRTFRIELEVDNKQRRMRNGVTADIYIPLEATTGHQISPAFLTLNDEGKIGVRSVVKGNMVRFYPVKILEQGASGMWITGLPQKVVIITVGQEYVIDGQKVDVKMEKTPNATNSTTSGDTSHERS